MPETITPTEAAHCRSCGAELEGRKDKVYCSDRCRKADARRSTDVETVAQDVEGSAPVLPVESKVIEGPDGLRGKEVQCPVHGCWYFKWQYPGSTGWLGQCSECAAEQALERRAVGAIAPR